MDREALLTEILSTLEDGRLSRGERRSAAQTLTEHLPSESARRTFAHSLVTRLADNASSDRDRDALEWFWDVIGLLWRDTGAGGGAKAYFGPEAPMVETLQGLIRGADRSLDLAVFTITDNRLTRALIDAHRRGVKVRILTDDDKQYDRGSDAAELSAAGLPVAFDGSPHHFHHKFAVIDGRILVNGSYNWTRGADRDNRENFLITEDPSLVRSFDEAFAGLWDELA